MNFVDTHVHLHFPDFQPHVDQVVEQARRSGVRFFVNVGTDLKSSRQSIVLAEKYDFVYATVGIHPHDVKDATPEDMCQLAGLAKHPKVIAIGEVGLDFYRNLSPEDIQRKVLIQFFEMAKQANLPLVLHIREAYEAMIELLNAHFTPPVRAVSHCFSGSREIMEILVELGLFISFAGPVTYKKNDALRKTAQMCPEDRILIETDAPFLAPQAHRGKRNEPAFMLETARFIADLRGISVEKLGQIVSQNSQTLFARNFSG
ncbi:MAG: TatD family hydrolase [Candidatus Omnitrophica bacterium]|nr:TatD family hydrolase [Candidatus Omnitrophota bacterium]